VLSAIEEHAATRLAKTSVDGTVDTSRLLRVGYILAGAAIALALYKVASPKDPLTTVGRVLLPWADIQAPSRVAIRDVQPGDTEAARGQQIDISAEVGGLAEGEEVLLYYSTDDGQSADRPLPMTRPAGGYRFACQLPPDGGGLQQAASYRLAAGDARTRTYRLNVVSAPTIVVEQIDYEYPAYTGLLSHSVVRQGDIKALEGTRVTLHALANGEIRSASVDLECDGRPDVTLAPAGASATGSFALSLKDPRPTNYQLLLTNAADRQNTQPVRYTIDITPDLAPEIEFVGTPPDDVELPADGTLELEVKAEDPDFALSRVSLRADRGDRPLLDRALLEKIQRGQFSQTLSVPLGELGLKAGETLEYWAQADDNKRPQANRAQTARRTVRIVAPRQDPAQPPKQAEKDQQPERPNDRADQNPQQQPGQGAAENRGQDSDRRDQADSPSGKKDNGQRGDAQQDQREPAEGDNASDAQNQQRDQGDGHERGDGMKQQPAGKNEGGDDNDSSNGDGQRQAGPENQSGENEQSGEEKSAGENQAGEQKGSQQPGQQPQAGDRQQPGQGDEQPQAGDQAQGTGSRGQDAPNSSSDGNQAGDRQPSGAGQRGGRPQAGDQPVGSDGSDDGTAIERILQHQRENPAAENQKPGDDRGQGGQPADKTQERGGQPNEKSSTATRGQDAGDAQGQPTPADPHSADDADRVPNRRPDQDPAGAGPQSKGEKPEDGDNAQAEKRDSQAGQAGDDQGQEGSGSPGSDTKGSPAPQDDNRPRDIAPRTQPKGNPSAKDAARSPSNSKHQSNSDGGAEGDRSGGGKAGGGQKSNQPGEGEAGQNTPADQGGGAAQEPGEGETGERGGDGPQASGQTGQAGDQAGQGTRERRGDGNRAGGERPQEQGSDGPRQPDSAQQQPRQPGDAQPDSSQQPNQNAGQPGSDGEGPLQSVPSGGQPHEAPDPLRRAPAVNDGADAPNLEYARKATDLALEHLKDQLSKDEPDPALLAKLGWTREDLERFVRRWESLRRDAEGNAAEAKAARRELDQSLRSLGLKPRDTTLSSGGQRDDQSRGLKESRRTQPPAEYLERYKAYTQGTAKGK